MLQYILIGIYLILTTTGLILIKLGGNSGEIQIANSILNFSINLTSLLGLICYVCSFLLFTKVVAMYDLSYIFPIVTGIVQILAVIAAYFILKEQISVYTVIGIVLIIGGIVLMNIKK